MKSTLPLVDPSANWSDVCALVPALGQPADFQRCLEVFPVLEHAKTTPQDPRWHAEGDVWTHTKMVLRELVQLPDYATASDDERVTLFLSALLHYIAKYSTTVVDPETGAIGKPGHSRKGSVDARIALWTADAPFDQREQICRLVAKHQLPFHAVQGSRSGKTAEAIIRELSWEMDLRLLATLAEADMKGRECLDPANQESGLINVELFREMAREDGCFGRPRAFADDHTRVSYFRGVQLHPDYAYHQEPGSVVTVMAGLPASGKNSWVEAHRRDLPVVSFDDAREELRLTYGDNDGAAAHLVIDRAKALLRKKEPFVWNATNVNPQLRQKALDLLFSYGAEVEIVYLEVLRKELFQRNARRDTTLSNAKLEQMLLKWEVPLPTESHRVIYQAAAQEPAARRRAGIARQ